MNRRNDNRFTRFAFMGIALIAIWVFYAMNPDSLRTQISHDYFYGLLSEDASSIQAIYIEQNEQTPTGRVVLDMGSQGLTSNILYYNVSDVNVIQDELDDMGINYYVEDVDAYAVVFNVIIPAVLCLGAIVFIILLMQRRQFGGGGAPAMSFGKSRARMVRETKENFASVAGLKEEKEELAEIVDFLKSPAKYTMLGARIPKGVILTGPPGTGKTLLARAVAGEAHVPFFYMSGSDFVEMFVGVGASRVRDLFADAKRNAPCIIFIDEIDAVARRRGSGLGGNHDEREQTLNQILVEMDGFGVNEGIIVMAATNRSDVLDPAILRPGRFDRNITVGIPDVAERLDIIKVHAKNKRLSSDVDLDKLARSTSGFSGADLENLLNEAAIAAAKSNSSYVTEADVERAFIKTGIGTEKKSKIISDKDKRITAYHEAGHAIIFKELGTIGQVHTISIIPTGNGAAGYTMPIPDENDMHATRGKMYDMITSLLGGRTAEEIACDDISSGASNDIMRATKIAKNMVMVYGMSDRAGIVNYSHEGDEIFIGRDFGQTKSYGEHMATIIDEEVKSILDECHARARDIINGRRDILERLCEMLIAKEKVSQEEFEALYA